MHSWLLSPDPHAACEYSQGYYDWCAHVALPPRLKELELETLQKYGPVVVRRGGAGRGGRAGAARGQAAMEGARGWVGRAGGGILFPKLWLFSFLRAAVQGARLQ